jgi:hypothetical protein
MWAQLTWAAPNLHSWLIQRSSFLPAESMVSSWPFIWESRYSMWSAQLCPLLVPKMQWQLSLSCRSCDKDNLLPISKFVLWDSSLQCSYFTLSSGCVHSTSQIKIFFLKKEKLMHSSLNIWNLMISLLKREKKRIRFRAWITSFTWLNLKYFIILCWTYNFIYNELFLSCMYP